MVQRKCDCGGPAGIAGQCGECEGKRLSTSAGASMQSKGRGNAFLAGRAYGASGGSGHGFKYVEQHIPPDPTKLDKPGEVPAQQAAPSACPCNPPILKGEDCKAKGHDKAVMDAFTKAAGWLPTAESKVDDFVTNQANRPGSAVSKGLAAHFSVAAGSSDEGTVAQQILSVIKNSAKNITQPICSHCPDTCASEDADSKNVAAISPFAWHKTNCYTFCPLFFNLDATTQAKVALHEMMHSWQSMGDAAYEMDGAPKYPPLTPIAKVTADCYAALIRDLG